MSFYFLTEFFRYFFVVLHEANNTLYMCKKFTVINTELSYSLLKI
jgi:hypothetical protein